MTAKARFDITMDADEKDVVSRAAALMGTTMAGFVRAAAMEKALALLDRESRVALSKREFAAFTRARLARRSDRQGQGLGKLLIACAVERCLQARKQVAAFALIVDAKNSNAKAFYEHYGFTPCVDVPLCAAS